MLAYRDIIHQLWIVGHHNIQRELIYPAKSKLLWDTIHQVFILGYILTELIHKP